jgi:hypothetical protein
MRTPIETMIDGVVAEILPPDTAAEREKEYRETGTPYATHSGVLKIGDLELKVYRLNTGQSIIGELHT